MFPDSTLKGLTFGLTISGSFIVSRSMPSELVSDSVKYWARYGLSLSRKRGQLNRLEHIDTGKYGLALEGGTLWTENFDEYRKMVMITFLAMINQTEVTVKIDLPYAWHVSAQERAKASKMLGGFHDYLEKNRKPPEEYVTVPLDESREDRGHTARSHS